MVRIPQSVEDLSEALVLCEDLWWRSPGSGASPWAKDGPWHLAQGEVGDVRGHYSETLIVNEAGKELRVRKVDWPRPRAALDAAEVDERDRVTAWLDLVEDVLLRRAIRAVAWQMWREGLDCSAMARVGWKQLAGQLGWTKTPEGLKVAVRREMALLVCRLNGWPTRRWRALVGRGHGLAEVPERARISAPVAIGEVA